MNYNKNKLIFGGVIILLVVIDLFSKYLVFTTTFESAESLFFIEPVKNFGSALGIFSEIMFYSQIVALISMVLIGFLFYELFFSKSNHEFTHPLFLITLLSGIIGNTFDRIVYGYVRDIFGINGFFVYNFADVYLTFACLFGVYLLYRDHKSQKYSSNKKAKF